MLSRRICDAKSLEKMYKLIDEKGFEFFIMKADVAPVLVYFRILFHING